MSVGHAVSVDRGIDFVSHVVNWVQGNVRLSRIDLEQKSEGCVALRGEQRNIDSFLRKQTSRELLTSLASCSSKNDIDLKARAPSNHDDVMTRIRLGSPSLRTRRVVSKL